MSSYSVRNRITLGLAALLSGTALLFTVGTGSAPASASVNAGKIAIGYENNGADPSIISVANHYFQKELGNGVSTKLFSSGPAALSALASGALPFMCGLGFPPVISAIAQGVPLQIIFNQERYTTDAGLVVKTSSGIKSVSGLKGKSVAIVIGSQSSFELATFAAQAKLQLSSIKQINMTPPEMQSAWARGSIDAAIVWDPAFDYLSTHGGKVLATDATLPPTATSFNICVANKKFAAAHPAVAKAFITALGDGVTYLQKHHANALSVMAKAAGINIATAKKEIAGYQIYTVANQSSASVLGTSFATSAKSGTGQSLLNNWKALKAAGTILVAPPSNVGPFVNPTYAKAAA
ncbi:MAG TPA: ABC transporter substrate-binding protein [Acidimicrobiales bacterium]|nr:ABC transporter substrate-binding protein [Acidimicrobiales bacterium]